MRSTSLAAVLFGLLCLPAAAAPFRAVTLQAGAPDAGWTDGGAVPPLWATGLNDFGQLVATTGLELFVLDHLNGVYFLDQNNDGRNDLLQPVATLNGAPAYLGADPRGISNRGHVAGHTFAGGTSYGFVAQGGAARSLTGASNATVAYGAVNARGEVAGTGSVPACGLGDSRAVAWTLGKVVSVGNLCGNNCSCNSVGLGINDLGHVVGNARAPQANGELHAFYWDGTMLDIHSLGYLSGASDINERDQVVGTFYERLPDGGNEGRPYLWQRGAGMVDLGRAFPAAVNTLAYHVNNLGQVGGRAEMPDPVRGGTMQVGFLYLPAPAYGLDAGFHDLEALTGLPIDNVRDLNDFGQLLVERRGFGADTLLVPDGVVPPQNLGTAGDHPESSDDADPVSTFTGELFTELADDLRLDGPLPLGFGRYYASALDTAGPESTLGLNWRHTYDWRLLRDESGVAVRSPTGKSVRFVRSGAAWQVSRSPVPHQLLEQGGGFSFVDATTRKVYGFDAAGRLTRLADLNGGALTLTYAADAGLSSVSDGLGRSLSLGYDADGRLASLTDGTRTVRYTYADGNLATFVDASGNSTAYRYASEGPGLLAACTLPRGNAPYAQAFDSLGRVTTQTDALGGATRFDFLGAQTRVTNPLGGAMTHTHAGGRLTGVVDAAGNTVSIAYDAQGRRTAVTGRDGAVTQFEYDPVSGRLARETYPGNRVYERTWSVASLLGATVYLPAQVTFPDGSIEAFVHDANGRLTAATDRAGRTVSTAWANGRPSSRTFPTGLVVSYAWNADGSLASIGTAEGGTSFWGYDALGRRSSVTWPGGATQRISYDAADLPRWVEDEAGARTHYEWDANRNLTAVTDALGNVARVRYDALDRPLELIDPSGASRTLRYDAAGKLAELTGPRGEKYTFERDAVGLIKKYLDPAGNAWTFEHDAHGRVLSSTNPLGQAVRFAYDPAGRLSAVTDGLGVESKLQWSAAGRLTGLETPSGRFAYEADASGEVTAITAPGGASTRVTLDAAGMIAQLTDPNGSVWKYERDALGRLSARVDPLGNRTEVQRDARGREQEIALPGGGRVQLTYDAAGRVTARRFSDGLEQRFGYDALGQRTSANGVALGYDADGNLTSCNGLQLGYDASARMKSVTVAPGKEVRYGYDSRGLLTSVTDWEGGVTTFEYDAASRPTRQTRPNGAVTQWSHDAAGRVTGIAESGAFGQASITLVRDAAGNITSAARELPLEPGVSEALAAALTAQRPVDAAHRLTAFEFDGLGRQVTDGARRFVWNLASQLLGIQGADEASFSYDGLGGLVSRSVEGRERKLVWNYGTALPSVVMELEGGEPATWYVHTPQGSLLYAVDARSKARRHYHYDERGSTVFRTGDSGELLDAWAYDPFGRVLASTGGSDNPFTFSGALGVIAEGQSGLYHMRRRVYDSSTGRFLSRDPISNRLHPVKTNPYAYAAGNPVRNVDPVGEEPSAWDSPAAAFNAFVAGAVNQVDPISGVMAELPNPAPVEKLLDRGTSAVSESSQEVLDNTLTVSGHILDASEFVGERLQEGAEALEQTLRVTGLNQGKSKAELVEQVGKLTRIEGFGKGLAEAAGSVSTITDNVGRGLELVKYHQKTKELLRENTAAQSGNTSSLLRTTEAIESVEGKLVSRSLAYAWKKELEADFNTSVNAATDAYQYGVAAQTLETGKNIYKSFQSWGVGIIADQVESAVKPRSGGEL